MGLNPQPIIITTTHKTSEQSRSLSKILEHVIPESIYIPRGSKNIIEILELANEINAEYVYICHSQGNRVSEIKFYKNKTNELEELDYSLKIYEYIDYKIFGWTSPPEVGPLSLTRESRNEHPQMVDFLEKIFRLKIGEKTHLWLLLDVDKNNGYLQFVDALTIRPFTHLRISIKSYIQN